MVLITIAAPDTTQPIIMLFAIVEVASLETKLVSCASFCRLKIDESISTFEVEVSIAKSGEKKADNLDNGETFFHKSTPKYQYCFCNNNFVIAPSLITDV